MNFLNDQEQKQVIHITDKDIAKIVLHPLRSRILRELREEHTVKELAQRLGVQQTKLYYHIELLEKAKLIEVVSSRMIGNLEERSYRDLAKDYSVELSDASQELLDDAERSIASAFPAAKAEMLAAYRRARAESEARKAAGLPPEEDSTTMAVKFGQLKLDAAGKKAFTERIEALMRELHSDSGEPYSLFYALYPEGDRQHESN